MIKPGQQNVRPFSKQSETLLRQKPNVKEFSRKTFTCEEKTSSFRDVSAIVDVKETFDHVTGLNTDSGRMFRLYNAAFKRLPDPEG